MDNKLIQILVHEVLVTEEYTLDGLALYTDVPYDVIYDIACGVNKCLSITSWAKIVDVYLKVKPEVSKLLFEKLLELKNNDSFSSLLDVSIKEEE